MADPILPTQVGDFDFPEYEPLLLASGTPLYGVRLRYAVYGELNEDRSNAILVCHALSGSSLVGDWWPQLFGEAGVFDLERDCIIGVNILGSCYGSTGPGSINPATGAVYGPEFPLVTTRDWAHSQARLLDHLGIDALQAVIGASIGGMQAIQWAIDYPQRVGCCVAIGVAPLNAMGLALNHLQRQAIYNDPNWRGGNYAAENPPAAGLALARAIAMCSYKSTDLFAHRYGRNRNRNGEDPSRSMRERYDIGGYLDYQGEMFTRRFDANSYLLISKAMDNFDLAAGYSSEAAALKRIRARMLLVGISSDWLFPPGEIRALADRMLQAGIETDYTELQTSHGHDGFLAEPGALTPLLQHHLSLRDYSF